MHDRQRLPFGLLHPLFAPSLQALSPSQRKHLRSNKRRAPVSPVTGIGVTHPPTGTGQRFSDTVATAVVSLQIPGLHPPIHHLGHLHHPERLGAFLQGERSCVDGGGATALANVLFSLGSEASARPCPRLWACAQNTQLSLLVLAGGGAERYLWRELKLVLCEEVNWIRALYSLRHTLWPGGVFIKSIKKTPSEAELEQLKRKAADAFKKFLPSEYSIEC